MQCRNAAERGTGMGRKTLAASPLSEGVAVYLEQKKISETMRVRFQLILDKITSNPKKLFLVDSLGAVLTAFFLGVILVRFEDGFGMPKTALYFLSSIACIYALYSICCYFLAAEIWKSYLLKGLIVANLVYCCLTIAAIFYFYQKLTILGRIYFLLELVIMGALIIGERMALSNIVYRKKLKTNTPIEIFSTKFPQCDKGCQRSH